jgi:SAM-dependent methyltransferase
MVIPQLEFSVADAADLSAFRDESFDAVVFAFNGIDFVLPDGDRRACLGHVYRILKPGGVMIFSSHNPRAILAWRGWNREHLQRIARRLAGRTAWLYSVSFGALASVRFVLSVGQSVWSSLLRFLHRVLSPTFWRRREPCRYRPRRFAYPLLDPGTGNRRTGQFSVSDRPHCGE